jgi:hypothetical protein
MLLDLYLEFVQFTVLENSFERVGARADCCRPRELPAERGCGRGDVDALTDEEARLADACARPLVDRNPAPFACSAGRIVLNPDAGSISAVPHGQNRSLSARAGSAPDNSTLVESAAKIFELQRRRVQHFRSPSVAGNLLRGNQACRVACVAEASLKEGVPVPW